MHFCSLLQDACFGAVRREPNHSEDEILTFLLQSSEQLPHKIPLYGTLIGLLNLENEEFVKKILESTHKSLQDALDSGDCNKIRVLMRFLTVLQIPEEIERVMVGIEAYLGIKRHVSDVGLFVFEDINKMNKLNVEQ
ncbi:hypothetical protein R6Q57_019603, partial [Mikania cordata]